MSSKEDTASGPSRQDNSPTANPFAGPANPPPVTINAREARRLAAAVEMLTQDLLIPVDVDPRLNGDNATRFRLVPSFLPTDAQAGPDLPTIAHAIAQALTVWSTRLKYAADAIRERHPLPQSANQDAGKAGVP